jgi:hypothetical protein
MPFSRFVEDYSISQNLFNLHCGIERDNLVFKIMMKKRHLDGSQNNETCIPIRLANREAV